MAAPLQRRVFDQATLNHFLDLYERSSRGPAFAERPSFLACDFSGLDFSGRDLTNFSAIGCRFVNADLSRSNLSFANLYAADLRGAILKNVEFTRADLRGACLRSADLGGANLQEASLERGALFFASIDGGFRDTAVPVKSAYYRQIHHLAPEPIRDTDMRGVILEHADISDSDLSFTDLTGANLTGANLTRSNLTGARFFGANLTGAKLQGAKLRQTNFVTAIYDSAQFKDCDISGTVFPRQMPDFDSEFPRRLARHTRWVQSLGSEGERLDFTMIDLRGKKFDGLDLSAAVFTLSLLDEASFAGCYMAMAELNGVSARKAHFDKADLRGSNLTRGNFTLASFQGANLGMMDIAGMHPMSVPTRLTQSCIMAANFDNAVLTGADLELADATEARFTSANLAGAVLINTYCYGANFRGTNFDNAVLTHVRGLEFSLT
ncbi:MAG: pentapeptide repeat-containing protein [Elstera sp.]|jgi:uncharacterized protein YjbI with pentapeptide repeats